MMGGNFGSLAGAFILLPILIGALIVIGLAFGLGILIGLWI